MKINIQLKIKFRAWGITFHQMNKAWQLDLSQPTPQFLTLIPTEFPPEQAWRLYDTRGILLAAWLG